MSKKITELSRLSVAANTDVLLIVENPTSTPTNKYIEVGDLMDNSGAVALGGIDIDGGTDIGADIEDADLLIVDDGGAGTNRKTTASRIKTYVGATAGGFPIANLDIDGGTVLATAVNDADLFIIDDGAGGTNRKVTAATLKAYFHS
jgi:hypothetical protein